MIPRRRDLAAKAPYPSSRQLIWQFIRARAADFSVSDIFLSGHDEMAMIQRYVRALVKAGIVEMTSKQRGSHQPRYRLLRDVGIDAPRVSDRGRLVTHGRITEQCWNTMRLLNEFSARDLAVMASTEEHKVKLKFAASYCATLAKAGYLQIVHKAVTGPKHHHPAVYRFVKARFTGPKPPIAQECINAVWDPNLRQIVWHEEIDA